MQLGSPRGGDEMRRPDRNTASALSYVARLVVASVVIANLAFGLSAAANAVNALAATGSHPCNSTTPYGTVIAQPGDWDSQLPPSTGHDGADYSVYSNYKNGTCDRPPASGDGSNRWDTEYQCTELAIPVADAELAIGDRTSWVNAGWNGAADDMFAHHPSQLSAIGNGTGSLPSPGDLLVWASSGGSDPGHVGVIASIGGGYVTFAGENQSYGLVTIT